MPDLKFLIEIPTQIFKLFGNSNVAFLILNIATIFLILFNKTKVLIKIKFNIFDSIFFLLSFFFFISLFFAQAPFGFVEYSGLFSMYFLFKFFQSQKVSIPNFSRYLLIIINIISIVFYYISDFNRLFGLTNFNQTLTTYPNLWALIIGLFIINSLPKKRLFLLLTSSVAFFLTLSKTSILSLFVVLGIYIFSSFSKDTYKLILKNLCVILFGFILSIGISTLKEENRFALNRLQNATTTSINSYKQRFTFFNQSLDMFKDYPLFGVGPGNFKALQPSYASEFFTLSNHPHNLLLKILSENGIFVFMIFLICFLLYLLLNFKNLSDPNFLSVLFIFGQSMFDYNLGFSIVIILISYFLSKTINLRQRKLRIFNKIFTILLIQFITITLISSVKVVDSKLNQEDMMFLLSDNSKNLSLKYPNYWKFNPENFSDLTRYDNLMIHLDFMQDKPDVNFYRHLLKDIVSKTSINYNFLVLSEEVPYALKLACELELYQEFNDLRLAYTTELGKLNLKQAQENYENFDCNSKPRKVK